MSSRRHPRSPAVPPMDDDDLLCEILLRLPPQPSSLRRASAVCKRWRLVSEPGFFRRFRLRHRRNPPLLGFFDRDLVRSFLPALESPNRVPHRRFSLQPGDGGRLRSLGCRHGLMLIFVRERLQLLVWDPITGHQRRLAISSGFDATKTVVSGAVLRTAGVHFQVVLIAPDSDEEIQQKRVVACVYSSETGVWGNLVSTLVPSEHYCVVSMDPAMLVGDSLYWLLLGTSPNILEFDLERQSLTVIQMPVNISEDEANHGGQWDFTVTRAEGGGLGLILVSRLTAQLWKRKTDCDGIASWVLGRTFELDKLLSLNSKDKGLVYILGFAEENNVAFLWTMIGVFMIHLESLKFKNLFKTTLFSYYHSFESVYAAGTCVGDGHDGADLLVNM